LSHSPFRQLHERFEQALPIFHTNAGAGVFGQIKNTGFRGFSVRGKDKVAGEFSMVCAAHNFKKMAKAIFTGLIRPKL